MILRKIGKLVRGQSSFQIYSACILGSAIAFVPGFGQAPGLMAFLVALLALLNANLFLAAGIGVLAKILYWLLLPVLFHFGVWLVEGPFHGLFALLANAPVTAWFGFEYYVVSAGIIIGPLLGLLTAVLLHKQVIGLRRKLASWEKDSAAYEKWSQQWWVKVLAFVFIGGTKPKKGSWQDLTQQKMGNPVRLLGAALVAVVLVFGIIVLKFFDSTILTAYARSALERANGATVDVESVELSPVEGRLTVRGLQMANPEALDENLFSASVLSAELSGMSLLARKFVVERIEVSEATSGTPRSIPGRLVGPRPRPVEDPPVDEAAGEFSIEAVMENAEIWKTRLSRISEWVRRFAPEEKPAAEEVERRQTWRERLEEQAAALGYAQVASDQLIRRAPRLEIRELVANGVRLAQLPEEERVDFRGSHLSTQPWLLETAPSFQAQAHSGQFSVSFTGTGYTSAGGAHQLQFFYQDLPASTLAGMLKDPERFPLRSGSISIASEGRMEGTGIDFPLNVTVKDARIELSGLQPVDISSLEVPAQLGGTIAAPRLKVESDAFQQALRNAARGRLQEEAGRRLQDAVGEETTDRFRRMLGGD